jgi:hypothetical protein
MAAIAVLVPAYLWGLGAFHHLTSAQVVLLVGAVASGALEIA